MKHPIAFAMEMMGVGEFEYETKQCAKCNDWFVTHEEHVNCCYCDCRNGKFVCALCGKKFSTIHNTEPPKSRMCIPCQAETKYERSIGRPSIVGATKGKRKRK